MKAELTAGAYAYALAELEPTLPARHRAPLVHYAALARTSTAAELVVGVGHAGYSSVNLTVRQARKRVRGLLGHSPEFDVLIPVTFAAGGTSGHLDWTRPEDAHALEHLEWV